MPKTLKRGDSPNIRRSYIGSLGSPLAWACEGWNGQRYGTGYGSQPLAAYHDWLMITTRKKSVPEDWNYR